MKRFNQENKIHHFTPSEIKALTTLGYTLVKHDAGEYMVDFHNEESVQKFSKALTERTDISYQYGRENAGSKNLIVYRADQYEFHTDYLKYIGESQKPEQPINCSSYFALFAGSKVSALDLSAWDFSNIEDMSAMFRWCENLQRIKFPEQKQITRNLKICDEMFYGCSSIRMLDLSFIQFGNVVSAKCMFMMCKRLREIKADNSHIEESFEKYGMMFLGCGSLPDEYRQLFYKF